MSTTVFAAAPEIANDARIAVFALTLRASPIGQLVKAKLRVDVEDGDDNECR